jgi:D-inositol-3-phosphate glycosyltransferase
MPIRKPRIGLVVPALDLGGGVPSVAEFVCQAIERSGAYDLQLVSLSQSARDEIGVGLTKPTSWFRGVRKGDGCWQGRSFTRIGAFASEFEFQRYQPRQALSALLADCDLIQVVCGAPAWAWPVCRLGKPVAVQCATRAIIERRRRDATARGPKATWRRWMTTLTDHLDRKALQTVDAIQVENPWMLDYAREVNVGRDALIHYAPPGVDAARFRPAPLRDFRTDPYILCVGRLDDPRKNVGLLLDAYSNLPSKLKSSVRLVLAGSAGPEQAFWDKVEQLGLVDRVTFIRFPDAEALVRLYQAATVFALPSDEEGLGVVILEAMACGIPVVSTRSGGPDGIITDGHDGYLAATDAVRRMTERMRPRGPDAEGDMVQRPAPCWATAAWPFSTWMYAPTSRWCRLMAATRSSSTARFTTSANCAGRWKRRVAFRTTSDTEVLLVLFAREGERMLPKLRGMFAFAIWDAQTHELFLARDPYGIKPLYYTQTNDGLLFASQVKALLASGRVSTEPEPAGLAGFYLWGSVPEPWTLYRDVFALPAGTGCGCVTGVPDAPVCWHDIRTHWRGEGRNASAQELQETVRQAVTDSVRAHLVADVPVSVFLSGGIDSAAVAGLASGLVRQVEGITIGFDEFAGRHEDEVPVAAAIAAHYGLPHFVRRVSRAEFEQDIPRILDAMDQPSIDGVNTWFASKAAAERGYKVVLSGVGGDELFCGYSSFRQIPRAAALGRALAAIPGARALLNAPCAWLAQRRSQPKLAGLPMLWIRGRHLLPAPQPFPARRTACLDGTGHGTGRLDAAWRDTTRHEPRRSP